MDKSAIIRKYLPQDNFALIDLFKSYPPLSSLSYVVDRSPSYIKLAEYQGYSYDLFTAHENQRLIGSLLVAYDKVYLDKKENDIAYTCDLRLEIESRGKGIGDNLMIQGFKSIKSNLGESAKIFTCVLKDNKAGLKKNINISNSGLADMKKVAELKSYFIFPFYTKLKKTKKYNVRFANQNDIEDMFKLWEEVSINRNLAKVFIFESFKEWIDKTAKIDSFLIAEKENNMVGFLGLWNQKEIRRVIIYSQNWQMQIIRKLWNLAGKIAGIPYFPDAGQNLNFYNVQNLCIKENDCLSEILLEAFKFVRLNNSMFLAIGLDKRDLLNKELKSFISSTTELLLLSNYNLENNDKIFQTEISLG